MEKWEEFEEECFRYLKENYGNNDIEFIRKGKSDSTEPDIEVMKKGQFLFNMEVKMSSAQAGQFVLFANLENRRFEFSDKNKTEMNEYVEKIIDYMNSSFDLFKDAGTKGECISNINKTTLENWIINYYRNKNVEFLITKDRSFKIIPIDKLKDYFEVYAKYREKKSGTSKVPKKDKNTVLMFLSEIDRDLIFNQERFKNDQTFLIKSNMIHQKDEIEIDSKRYYVSEKSYEDNWVEIRKKSKVANSNIIFSIKAKQKSDDSDIEKFENIINN